MLPPKIKPLLLTILLLFLFFMPLSAAATAETTKRAAILPFTTHAAHDLAYLTSGMRDMLASRLAAGGAVSIISRHHVDEILAKTGQPAKPAEFQSIGQQLNSDYLVAGSITAFGDSISLDAKVYTIADNAPAKSFFVTAATKSDLINAIDQLAQKINTQFFEVKPAAARTPAAPTVTLPAPLPRDTTAHPARMFRGMDGSFLIRPQGGVGAFGFSKSQNLALDLQSMAIGDVNGDGHNELILADRTTIYIYRRLANNQLHKIGQFTPSGTDRIHSVTLADFNHDKRYEIYISAADHQRPISWGVEWQEEAKVNYLFTSNEWYIRAMQLPGEGMVLVGQRGDITRALRPGLYRLTRVNDTIVQSSELNITDKVNLFEFTLADIDNDGVSELIAINQFDRLRVMRKNGALLWESDTFFGGTTRFIGGGDPSQTTITFEEEQNPRIYIPSPIHIVDINNDGQLDVIINKNLASASRLFTHLRNYPSGEIHALSWNGLALAELWRTRKIDGYIVDYLLQPGPDAEQAELLVGVIVRGGGMAAAITRRTSAILSYPLDLAAE